MTLGSSLGSQIISKFDPNWLCALTFPATNLCAFGWISFWSLHRQVLNWQPLTVIIFISRQTNIIVGGSTSPRFLSKCIYILGDIPLTMSNCHVMSSLSSHLACQCSASWPKPSAPSSQPSTWRPWSLLPPVASPPPLGAIIYAACLP